MVRRLCVVILNFRTPDMTIDCLASLVLQLDAARDRVIVLDNCSGDDSPAALSQAVRENGWEAVVSVVESDRNGGFGYGNNFAIRLEPAEMYLLLNSDTVVRAGAIAELLLASATNPDAGLISPRLEWPDSTGQVSCFRFRSPRTEFLRAAGTGLITRLLGGGEVGLPLSGEPTSPDWTSFAAVLIRREVFEKIGLLDDGFFMYFEDIDFCRRARHAGFNILNCPAAHIVHLRGGSSSAKHDLARRDRLPRYVYESRARYFSRYYGRPGLWLTNILWYIGAAISMTRAIIQRRRHHHCKSEWRDNWIHAFRTHSPPVDQIREPDSPAAQDEVNHAAA